MPLRLAARTPRICSPSALFSPRCFTVLGIETSCDDTSVAVLRSSLDSPVELLFHKTITSPNRQYGGIHPMVSLQSHRTHLALLLRESLGSLPSSKPDLVAVTRGPGMMSSLAVGLDTAKGLSVAWGCPLIGVHHMQAHALTPRLISSLEQPMVTFGTHSPMFPFLTLLVSGGHTMLVYSKGLVSHSILATTLDIAIGDMIDKCARLILPANYINEQGEAIAYGRLLEQFCFPGAEADWNYHSITTQLRRREKQANIDKWGDWKLNKPLSKDKIQKGRMAFSFSGLGSDVERYCEAKGASLSDEERKALGRWVFVLAFEHLAEKIVTALENLPDTKTLVVSGGVASNRFMKHLLKTYLAEARFSAVQLVTPPVQYCTDNAAMIAWAGLEMFRAGWETNLDVHPIRKWSLDENSTLEARDEDQETNNELRSGVLGVNGWKRRKP